MSTSPLRAVGYARTSGEGQRDNTSIPRQKAAVEAACTKNGWQFVRHYVDESRSGAKTEGRDEFQAMLRAAANKEFDVLVPYDSTRLARDGVDVVSTAKVLREFGVAVVSANGQFDNRDHRNALSNFVQAGVSEHERLTIMERMLGARVAKARAGLKWSGNAPVGRQFRKTGKQSGEWSVTDRGRDLAALLARYVAGERMPDLSKEFGFSNAAHVQRHVREGQLAAAPYVVVFNTPEVGITNLRVEVPAVPPVISPALEKRVMDRLAHNRTWNKQALRKYVLGGFVRCGACGTSLVGGTTDGHSYYQHHRNVGAGGKACPFRSVRGDVVEGPVLGYLYDLFIDQPAFDLAVTLGLPDAADRTEREQDARRTERDLADAEKAISRLVDAIAEGADPALLVGKQQELKAKRDALRQRLADARGTLAALPDPAAVRAEAEELRSLIAYEQTGKDWRREAFDDVRRFLHFLFGDNPRKEKLGVYVRLEGGRFTAEVRARLRVRSPDYLVGEDGFARPYSPRAGGQAVEFSIPPLPVNLFTTTR